MFYTAVIQKEFKWAEKFIKEHINELSPEQKEDMEHYSKAVLYFEKNKFESSLEEISKVKYKYFIYKYDVKLLMLKSYYELGYFENALFLIDSFSHFLSKNRTVSELEKERFGNFLLNLKSLIKIKTGSASGKGDDLYRIISGIRVINSRKWLLEKAKELAKSKK